MIFGLLSMSPQVIKKCLVGHRNCKYSTSIFISSHLALSISANSPMDKLWVRLIRYYICNPTAYCDAYQGCHTPQIHQRRDRRNYRPPSRATEQNAKKCDEVVSHSTRMLYPHENGDVYLCMHKSKCRIKSASYSNVGFESAHRYLVFLYRNLIKSYTAGNV